MARAHSHFVVRARCDSAPGLTLLLQFRRQILRHAYGVACCTYSMQIGYFAMVLNIAVGMQHGRLDNVAHESPCPF